MNKSNYNKEFSFNIISGKLKNRKITAPNLGITRPPLSRLRKSIFDFLTPYILDSRYLDLFSGTGSYLFEAVSRGASLAIGVELNEILAENINNQAAKCKIQNQLRCLNDNVYQAVPKMSQGNSVYDIIMIAPPQYKKMIDQTLSVLSSNQIYHSESLIITQHDTSETKDTDFSLFDIFQQRKYGNTTFTILKQK